MVGMIEKSIIKIIQNLTSKEDKVGDLIAKSYLSEKLKHNYHLQKVIMPLFMIFSKQ